MSNLPYFNFYNFFKYEKILASRGYEVLSPAHKSIEAFGDAWKQCPTGSYDELKAVGAVRL